MSKKGTSHGLSKRKPRITPTLTVLVDHPTRCTYTWRSDRKCSPSSMYVSSKHEAVRTINHPQVHRCVPVMIVEIKLITRNFHGECRCVLLWCTRLDSATKTFIARFFKEDINKVRFPQGEFLRSVCWDINSFTLAL